MQKWVALRAIYKLTNFLGCFGQVYMAKIQQLLNRRWFPLHKVDAHTPEIPEVVSAKKTRGGIHRLNVVPQQ